MIFTIHHLVKKKYITRRSKIAQLNNIYIYKISGKFGTLTYALKIK